MHVTLILEAYLGTYPPTMMERFNANQPATRCIELNPGIFVHHIQYHVYTSDI